MSASGSIIAISPLKVKTKETVLEEDCPKRQLPPHDDESPKRNGLADGRLGVRAGLKASPLFIEVCADELIIIDRKVEEKPDRNPFPGHQAEHPAEPGFPQEILPFGFLHKMIDAVLGDICAVDSRRPG
jgi:hypothetical protein